MLLVEQLCAPLWGASVLPAPVQEMREVAQQKPERHLPAPVRGLPRLALAYAPPGSPGLWEGLARAHAPLLQFPVPLLAGARFEFPNPGWLQAAFHADLGDGQPLFRSRELHVSQSLLLVV